MTAATARKAVLALASTLLVGALAAPAPAQVDVPLPLPLPDLGAAELLGIAGVDLPPAGVTLQLHADFPVDAPLEIGGVGFTSLTADVSPEGGVTMLSATPPPQRARRRWASTSAPTPRSRLPAPAGTPETSR